jgi:hypothetical protein
VTPPTVGETGVAAAPGDASTPRWTARRAWSLTVVFVVILAALLVTAFPDGRAGKSGMDVPLTAQYDELEPIVGGSDLRWYVELGYELAEHRDVPSEERWRLNFWPPGNYLYWAVLYTMLGPDLPAGVTAAIALAVLFAAILTAYAELFARYYPRWMVGIGLALVVLSDALSKGIFRQYLLMSEGLYTWWMLVALYAALRLALSNSPRARTAWALGAGAALGASAYVRTTSELLGRVLTTIVLVWVVVVVARRAFLAMRARRTGAVRARHPWSRSLISLLLCMAAFHAVTIPWRIVAAQTVRPGNYSWSAATNRYWHLQWTTDRVFAANGLAWMPPGGANTACRIEPEKCRTAWRNPHTNPRGIPDRVQTRLRDWTLDSMVSHPTEWIRRQLPLPLHAWFGAAIPCGGGYQMPNCRAAPGVSGSGHELGQNALLLAALVAAVVLSLRRMARRGADLLALLIPCLAVTIAAPLVLLIWEPRYFLPLKILLLFALPALLVADRASDAEECPRTAQPVVT